MLWYLLGDLMRASDAAEIIATPEEMWMTAESLVDCDQAIIAWPKIPAVFGFDEALLFEPTSAEPPCSLLRSWPVSPSGEPCGSGWRSRR